MAERVRVLSIDGGGIRGLIPALVLAEVEARAGRPVADLFDLIAGTSTGGILACALTAPEALPAAELVGLYEERGPEIFDRSVWQRIHSVEGLTDEKYDGAALDGALAHYLSDKRLSEVRPDLIVPAYDTAGPAPFFFKSSKARERAEHDFPLAVVARATSAAPTYFEALRVGEMSLVDGGVFAVNPAMCAFAEVLRHSPKAEVVLLSLGTGERIHRRPFEEIKDWGLAQWARPILDVVFDGVSDAVDYQLRHALVSGGYWRIQTELRGASDNLDDASERNLRSLRGRAEELIEEQTDDIDAAVEALFRQGSG